MERVIEGGCEVSPIVVADDDKRGCAFWSDLSLIAFVKNWLIRCCCRKTGTFLSFHVLVWQWRGGGYFKSSSSLGFATAAPYWVTASVCTAGKGCLTGLLLRGRGRGIQADNRPKRFHLPACSLERNFWPPPILPGLFQWLFTLSSDLKRVIGPTVLMWGNGGLIGLFGP